MNKIISKIDIDLNQPQSARVIHAVQGERNSRCIQVSIFGDTSPWEIPENTQIAVRYGGVGMAGGYYDALPDGTPAASYEGNTVTIICAPQMTATAGCVSIQIEMRYGNNILTTFTFKMVVEVNPAEAFVAQEGYTNWMQWMDDKLKEHIQALIESGAITGPVGPQGESASVTDYEVVYQASQSGNTVPSGQWEETVPYVVAGKYLWTRTTIIFNHTDSVLFYTVSRMGMDGAGSICSVCGISPDEHGNVALNAENVHALSVKGGTMNGPVNMSGHRIVGLNDPTEDSEAATKGYALRLLKTVYPRNLLDNSDFRKPVNQRGQTVYTSNGYSIDRWLINNGSMTINSNSITITSGWLYQFLEGLDTAKPYTLAWCDETGHVAVNNNPIRTDLSEYPAVVIDPGDSKDLLWAALYEGEYTTETLPVYQSKGYGAELMECQRYYYVSTFDTQAIAFDAYSFYSPYLSLTVTMRDSVYRTVTPFSKSGTENAISMWNGSQYIDVSDIIIVADKAGVTFRSNGGFYAGSIYTTSKIVISAELI